MQNLNPYLSYKELIRRGWFGRHIEELEGLLRLLEKEGRITGEQSRHLLQLASDKHTAEATRLERSRSHVVPGAGDHPASG